MAYNEEKLIKLKALKQLAESVRTGFATKEELASSINAKLSSTYKAGGSVDFEDLPELTESNLGLVVNVTGGFTTTGSFVEGAGRHYPAGTNVAVVVSGEEYKYDVLAGFVDLSGCVEKEDGKGLSSNDFTDEYKEQIANLPATITNAITTMDDNFAHRYGLSITGDETIKVFFSLDGFSSSINVSAGDSIQTVAGKLNSFLMNEGYEAAYDAASGQLVISDDDGAPVEFTARQNSSSGPLLSYTPGERVGPMFSFNGRSGQVVPMAGDYTPEMLGLSVADDAEVSEMLTGVFHTAD